jgi:hypothetical protein
MAEVIEALIFDLWNGWQRAKGLTKKPSERSTTRTAIASAEGGPAREGCYNDRSEMVIVPAST